MEDLFKKGKRFRLGKIIPGWHYTEYLLLRGLAGLINLLPLAASVWLARRAGDLLYLVMPKRRKIAFYNLDLAFGDTAAAARKKQIARESFRHLATSLVEFFRIPRLKSEAANRFIFSGVHHLEDAFAKFHGIVLVISHLGSWELLGFLPYLKGFQCAVVGKAMRNPYVYEWVKSLRAATSLKHIDKKNAAKEILRELHKNHLVAILIDQWDGPDGLRVPFFDHPTSTTSIPARLARKTQAVLIPGYCLRLRPGYYEIRIKPPVSVQDAEGEDWERATTEKLNRLLEEQIRLYTEQWTWTHRRWKGAARLKD